MADAGGGGWTEERVELLGKLWGDGLSASQIAGVLGGGVTRNAVIGKVHRLGLAGRAKSGGQPAAARKPKPRQVTAPSLEAGQVQPDEPPEAEPAPRMPVSHAAPSQAVAIPVSQRVSILDLRDTMCRWPLGDPQSADFGFCGARSATGLPYCHDHCRIAYQPAAERRRLRA